MDLGSDFQLPCKSQGVSVTVIPGKQRQADPRGYKLVRLAKAVASRFSERTWSLKNGLGMMAYAFNPRT